MFLDESQDIHLGFSEEPMKVTPKFDPAHTSLLFDVPDAHEEWESDPEAPKEMILSFASSQNKGEGADQYDISSSSKPFSCPTSF